MHNLFLTSLLFLTAAAHAQTTGYVVKADTGRVYLDLNASNGISLGQNFVVYTDGEELKHPITGASLGRVENLVAKGHIEQIMDRYSVGRLEPDQPGKAVAGQKIRILSTFTQSAVPAQQPQAAAAAVPTAAPPPASSEGAPTTIMGAISSMLSSGSSQPAAAGKGALWKSPVLDMEAVGIALGDVNGDGTPEVIVADNNRVLAYPQTGEWKPLCQYTNTGTGSKILSIDAVDLNKSGRAQVFATYYNAVLEHVETAILECKGNTFEKTATLPFMTRAFYDASGEVKLGTQQLLEDSTFPFGSLYLLEYKDGKYSTGAQIKAKRVEWLYGFILAKDATNNEPFPIFITQTNSLRIQFKKKAWVSEEAYGQTASRLAWQHRDRSLMFYPRLIPAYKDGNLDGLYALENVPSLGSLGGIFGYFRDAKLHFLRWNGMSFTREWTSPTFGGYAADIAAVRSADGHLQELWTAVVGAEGRTTVMKFQP